MVKLYAMFQIREAAGQLQMFFKLGVLKNFTNLIGFILFQCLLCLTEKNKW